MITDNELIARFMGGVSQKATSYCISDYPNELPLHILKDLTYHKSWDWLMPVVQKVFDTDFGDKFEEWRVLNGRIMNAIGRIDIADTHKKVVDFIKWYNMQSK